MKISKRLLLPPLKWESGFSGKQAVDYLQDALQDVLPEPSEQPVMPDNITTITNDELGEAHGHFCAYLRYLESRLALAEIEATEAEAHHAHVEARIRLLKAGTVKDKDTKTRNDPQFVLSEQALLTAQAKARLLKARVKGDGYCASALSREMSRRQGEYDERKG